MGLGVKDGLQGREASLKVWYEDFHLGIGCHLLYRPDRFCKVVGTTIWKVIPGYRGDDHMAQSHPFDSFRHPVGFFGVWRCQRTMGNGTESTIAGAAVSEDKECGGSMRKTLPKIWAACFLANRVELAPL
jgi:hypothetical protein